MRGERFRAAAHWCAPSAPRADLACDHYILGQALSLPAHRQSCAGFGCGELHRCDFATDAQGVRHGAARHRRIRHGLFHGTIAAALLPHVARG